MLQELKQLYRGVAGNLRGFFAESAFRSYSEEFIKQHNLEGRYIVFSVPLTLRDNNKYKIQEKADIAIQQFFRNLTPKMYLAIQQYAYKSGAKDKTLRSACLGIVDFVNFCIRRQIPDYLNPPDWIPTNIIPREPVPTLLAIVAAYYPDEFVVRMTHLDGKDICLKRSPFVRDWRLVIGDKTFDILDKGLGWGKCRFNYAFHENDGKKSVTILISTKGMGQYLMIVFSSTGKGIVSLINITKRNYRNIISGKRTIGPYLFVRNVRNMRADYYNGEPIELFMKNRGTNTILINTVKHVSSDVYPGIDLSEGRWTVIDLTYKRPCILLEE